MDVHLDELIGESAGIAAIREKIGSFLSRASHVRRLPPILIQGETGTGKGLLARTLHRAGPRAEGPFVDVNCAAIPETLLEAEMFGFERGAFTDARQAKRGLFQAAHRGTLFLDEIGLLSDGLQAKLLKVIEERTVRRLGSTQSEPVDVWIIAATNADLAATVRARRFREDLYHRLAVLTLVLPPLRERGRDVLRLAEHFLGRACADYGLAPKTLESEARETLLLYTWPGNVRELGNVMERVSLLSDAAVVTAATLGLSPGEPGASPAPANAGSPAARPSLADAVDSVEREHLLDALRETGWNVSRAAARLGISRNTLRYRMEKHGLARGTPAPPPRVRAPRPAAPTPLARSPEPVEAPTPPALRWERRRLTVLRALVDPADATGPLHASRAIEVFVDKVETFGGRVEELGATGIVGIFGIEPLEDAPRRAANAAMAIQRAAERLREGAVLSFAPRAGIHVAQCMMARVGATAQIDEQPKREALETVTRLVADAEPGAIAVSDAAARFLRRRFELIPMGPAAGAHPAYRLGRSEGAEFGRGRGLARFVGRSREIELLRSLLGSTVSGRGQVVGIVGEPGIGKSRLLFEFRQSLASEPVVYLEGHCFEYATAIPYLPVLDVLKQTCRISETDLAPAIVEKVRTGLERAGMEADEAAPYLLHLLGLREGTERLAAVSPEIVKTRTLETLRQLTLRSSRIRPLILAIEDLHWRDSSSEELIASLLESVAATPVLFLATYRPGYAPPWMQRSYSTQMALGPLSSQDSLAVVESVLEVTEVPEPLAEVILDKAQGNPLFLEELARSAREKGGSPEALTVSGTIEEVLLVRIDRLSPQDKRLLQSAAVIGRTVPFALLRAVATLSDDALRQALARLRAAEFLHEASLDPELAYTFKHALTHEVAYTSLLEEQRRLLHGRIVEAIEELYRDRFDEQIERLADHAVRAGLPGKALVYLQQAGAKASARSANREAVSHLTRGLELVASLPESPERRRQELDLLIALGPVEINIRGARTREVAHTYSRALELCSQLPESPQHFAALWGSWRISEHFETKHERAGELLALAERLGDPGLRLQAHHCLWASLFHLGQHEACCEHVEKGLRLYEAGDYRTHSSIYGGHDPKVCGIGERALALWLLGFPDQSLAASLEAMAWARQLTHAGTLVHALHMSLLLHCHRRDARTVQARAEELIDSSKEQGFAVHKAKGTVFVGWALSELDQTDSGIEYMRQGLEQQEATGTREDFPVFFDVLAAAYATAGRAQLGLDVLSQALAETKRNGLRYWTAELHRRRGELLLMLSSQHEAEAEFRRALEMARQQGARSLELRAAMSLARLEQRHGKAEAGYGLLAPIYAWFREGLDTVDLGEARALLAELAGSAPGAAAPTQFRPRATPE